MDHPHHWSVPPTNQVTAHVKSGSVAASASKSAEILNTWRAAAKHYRAKEIETFPKVQLSLIKASLQYKGWWHNRKKAQAMLVSDAGRLEMSPLTMFHGLYMVDVCLANAALFGSPRLFSMLHVLALWVAAKLYEPQARSLSDWEWRQDCIDVFLLSAFERKLFVLMTDQLLHNGSNLLFWFHFVVRAPILQLTEAEQKQHVDFMVNLAIHSCGFQQMFLMHPSILAHVFAKISFRARPLSFHRQLSAAFVDHVHLHPYYLDKAYRTLCEPLTFLLSARKEMPPEDKWFMTHDSFDASAWAAKEIGDFRLGRHNFVIQTPSMEMLEHLGEGAQCVVYSAHRPARNEVIACKRYRSDKHDHCLSDGGWTETNMMTELAKYPHANICSFLDAHLGPNCSVYVCMPLASESLSKWYRNNTYASIDLLRRIMKQVLNGIHHLHTHAIVHRDIKPSNVLVYREKDALRVKLADFGMAAFMIDSWTLPHGPNVVSPNYRAPELVTKPYEYNAGIDIFAFGCLCMELLIKRILFEDVGDSEKKHQQALSAHCDKPPSHFETFLTCHNRTPALSRAQMKQFATLFASIFVSDMHKRPTSSQLLCLPCFN